MDEPVKNSFDIEEAFTNKAEYVKLKLFEENPDLNNVTELIKPNGNPVTLTIQRKQDTPLSAFIINYLNPKPEVYNLPNYLKQIKQETIQDICRTKFTVNGEVIDYSGSKLTAEQLGGINLGRCVTNDDTVVEILFNTFYRQMFKEDMPPTVQSEDMPPTVQIENMPKNLNDFYAILVLSSQSVFADLASQIAATNNDIENTEDMLHLQGRFKFKYIPGITNKSSYEVNVTSTVSDLSVASVFHGEIYKVVNGVATAYAHVDAKITATLKPSPDVACTVDIIPIKNKLSKVLGEPLNEIKESRSTAKALKVLGMNNENNENNKGLFYSFFTKGVTKGGKYTKRNRKSKLRSKTRNKTRNKTCRLK